MGMGAMHQRRNHVKAVDHRRRIHPVLQAAHWLSILDRWAHVWPLVAQRPVDQRTAAWEVAIATKASAGTQQAPLTSRLATASSEFLAAVAMQPGSATSAG